MFDKPIYLGITFIELSKLYIFEDYYDFLQPFFDHQENIQLQYKDCDSLVTSIQKSDLVKDLIKMQEKNDLSDFKKFAKNHHL